MKNIVAAIDFSKGSIHALEYAINLANKIHSNITMVWVDKTSNNESVYIRDLDDYRMEVKRRFEELIKTYESKYFGGTFDYKLRRGKVYNEIVNQANSKPDSLIVAGSHGVSGYEQYWIGSNANRIVGHSKTPVITVRSDFEIRDAIREIVMPIDYTPETLLKVPYTAELAARFNAEIHLLIMYSTKLKTLARRIDSNAQRAAKYLESQNLSHYSEIKTTDNVTHTLIDYAVKMNADLISIISEKAGDDESGILGPSALQLVNNSPIPVLSMNNSETKI